VRLSVGVLLPLLRWLTTVTDPEHRGLAVPGSTANGVYRSRSGQNLDDAIDARFEA
jgi:hypothetical protein